MKQITSILIFILICSSLHGQDTTSAINDFDFYIGKWEVQNQRKMDDGKWIVFDANVEVKKTLQGYGNVDFFEAIIEDEPYSGMTIRFYDESRNEWYIKWYDSDDPMEEPAPSVGKFENGIGTFYKTITTDSGRQVKVRFYWYDIKEDSFLWESSWSIDGKIWNPTWKMEFKRIE